MNGQYVLASGADDVATMNTKEDETNRLNIDPVGSDTTPNFR